VHSASIYATIGAGADMVVLTRSGPRGFLTKLKTGRLKSLIVVLANTIQNLPCLLMVKLQMIWMMRLLP
jgi:hypothetical protein